MEILIVEDDKSLAKMLKIAFCASKFSADYLTEGKKAEKVALSAADLRLVILDLRLPGADGFKIAETIRKLRKNVQIVVLSASNRADDIERAIKIGVTDYFVKPFTFSELLNKTKLIMSGGAIAANNA